MLSLSPPSQIYGHHQSQISAILGGWLTIGALLKDDASSVAGMEGIKGNACDYLPCLESRCGEWSWECQVWNL